MSQSATERSRVAARPGGTRAAGVRAPRTAPRVRFLPHRCGGGGGRPVCSLLRQRLHFMPAALGLGSQAEEGRGEPARDRVPCRHASANTLQRRSGGLPRPAPPAPRPRPPPHTAGRSQHRCPALMSLARRTKPRAAAPALLPAHCSSPVPGTTAEPAAAPGPAQHPGDSQLGPQMTQRTAGRLLSTRRCGREGGSPLPPVSQLGPPGGIRRGAGSGG